MQKIINVAVIAHVDAGKSTLIDAMLAQSGTFSEHETPVDCIMDSDDIERERGITIYAKNCSVKYKDYKINIVDTPGHADFSSEVDRIIKTVDTVILLVDASEGPMPQTRYVLKRALAEGINPILLINKIDKKDQRAETVVDLTFDLFVELGANEEQLDFPILYGVAKQGVIVRELEDEGDNIAPLFETLVEHVAPYASDRANLQMQISSLAYDNYIGRLGIGRVLHGKIEAQSTIAIAKRDGAVVNRKIGKLFVYDGLKRTSVASAEAGELVLISGVADISIGETIGEVDKVEALPMLNIEAPTLSMNFYINSSPFAGRSGTYLTTRHIKERLDRECETNVGLRVESIPNSDAYVVSGRGELHLSILIENMRREGYELSISKPEVILRRDESGHLCEPMEIVNIEAPDEYVGTVIRKLNQRKGIMHNMFSENGFTNVEYVVPTRALIGFRAEFINDTRGEGTFLRRFDHYGRHVGEIASERMGAIVSGENGSAMAYALYNLQERGTLFIAPSEEVYEGMIVGLHNRSDDLVVNPTKNKKLTNTRASGSDDALNVQAPRTFTLEEALSFIAADEWVEVTPAAIRLRKQYLTHAERVKMAKKSQ